MLLRTRLETIAAAALTSIYTITYTHSHSLTCSSYWNWLCTLNCRHYFYYTCPDGFWSTTVFSFPFLFYSEVRKLLFYYTRKCRIFLCTTFHYKTTVRRFNWIRFSFAHVLLLLLLLLPLRDCHLCASYTLQIALINAICLSKIKSVQSRQTVANFQDVS